MSSKSKDGGPAFPALTVDSGLGFPVQAGTQGMSVRTWLAGQALAGMLANATLMAATTEIANEDKTDPEVVVARMAAEHADATMRALGLVDQVKVNDDEVEMLPQPVACQQCRNPACTKVCPVKATWQEPDGIVVIDSEWCIGCRCCMSACPYGARHFNWTEPTIAAEEINPDTHVFGNRPRPKGVVEKCTFCIHRTRKGRYPACVEICPVGARKFGNLLDETGEMRYLMREKRVFVLKEELNTRPRFYYFYAT